MTYTLILSDDEKDIYSVRVTVKRMETIQSGSMQFNHPRYLTFGQMVIFTDKPISADQSGALVFKRERIEETLNNIIEHIPHTKDIPDSCLLMDEEDDTP